MAGEDRLERRISAVLAMDVSGYTRLMGLDEAGTFVRWQQKLRELIEPQVAAAQGRVFKTMGDGVLAEFAGGAEAVCCAADIQRLNEASEAAIPIERRMRLRIGISLSEVIVQGDDLYGDGVNTAARLEASADVGGIAVSEAIAQAGQATGHVFLDLGLIHLKNLARPVRIYKVAMDGEATGPERPAGTTLVSGFGERPAIAILPFRSYPPAVEGDYFADGITEDLIVALSRWRSFPVISRNSVFALKDKEFDLSFAAQQLGARFIAQGSVRQVGNRVRTLMQLHDVETADTLLAEQYDSDLGDVFATQDEIVRTIVGAIEPELLRRERERMIRQPQQDPTAYEALQRGHWHHYRYTAQDNLQARALFNHALAIDPDYAQARAALSLALVFASHSGWGTDPQAMRQDALTMARQAVQADGRDPQAHFSLGLALCHTSATADAMRELQEAIRLNPSHAAAHANLAFVYNYQDRPTDALAEVLLALRLSPHDPRRFIWLPALAGAHYLLRDYLAALRAGQEALTAKPSYLPVIRYIVASLGQLGHREDAAKVMPVLRRLDKDLAATEAHLSEFYVAPAVVRIIDGLSKAGFA